MLLAAQAPLSAMLGATINVTNGKEWDDNLAIVAMRTATSLGYISLAIDPIASGGFTNSAVVLSPLTSTLRLGKALVNEDSSLLYFYLQYKIYLLMLPNKQPKPPQDIYLTC